MKKVLFVCMGNICRSPLAHAVFEHLVQDSGQAHAFKIESAGTNADYHAGENADPRMVEEARKNGVHLSHMARMLEDEDLEEYDHILVMDQRNLKEVLRRAEKKLSKEAQKKIELFRNYDPLGTGTEVEDPYLLGGEAFKDTYQVVRRTAENLLKTLI